MSDIAERLRLYAAAEVIHAPLNGGGFAVAREAADAIEARDAEIGRLRAEVQAMRRFIQDTAIDNGITAADSEDRFWRLSDGTYMPQSVINSVWNKEARRER